jgi:hypothetical protein
LTHDYLLVEKKWFEPVRTSFEGFVRVLFRPIAFATSDHERVYLEALSNALTRKLR